MLIAIGCKCILQLVSIFFCVYVFFSRRGNISRFFLVLCFASFFAIFVVEYCTDPFVTSSCRRYPRDPSEDSATPAQPGNGPCRSFSEALFIASRTATLQGVCVCSMYVFIRLHVAAQSDPVMSVSLLIISLSLLPPLGDKLRL